MGLTGKRFIILILLAVIVVTGLGSALMAQAAQSAAPTSTGVIFTTSALDKPVQSAQPVSAVSLSGQQASRSQVTVLDAQLEDAWRKGDWNRCIDVLTAVLTVDVANVEARERLYQARVNNGWLQLSSQQFEEAFKQFSIALQIRPGGQEATEGLRLLQQLIVCPATIVSPSAPACAPTPCPATCAVVVAPSSAAVVAVRIHVVQRGDTLFRLALRFNTSVAVIMKANGLQTTTIKVGQKLVIP